MKEEKESTRYTTLYDLSKEWDRQQREGSVPAGEKEPNNVGSDFSSQKSFDKISEDFEKSVDEKDMRRKKAWAESAEFAQSVARAKGIEYKSFEPNWKLIALELLKIYQ